MVPDAPFVVEFVVDASVENEAPERVSRLLNGAEGLDEEWGRAVWWVDFDDSLAHPGCEFDAERRLGSLVPLPASVVWAAGADQGEAGLGHNELAFDLCRL